MSVSQNRAKAAGSGIGAFFNNPGVLIIGALIVFIAFFRGDIRNAFGSLGESISGGLGDINIQLPEFNFPDINFPSLDFGGIFEGFNPFPSAVLGQEGEVLALPLTEDGINPAADPTNPTPVDILISEGETDPRIINPEAFDPEQAPQLFDPTMFQPPTEEGTGPIPRGGPSFEDLGLIAGGDQVQTELDTGQQFAGFGPSFEGGVVRETPLEFLSLNQISEMLGISASRAASLRAEAIGFDGGFIPEGFFEQEQQGLPEGIDAPDFGGFTGDPMFEGLTPEEIALRLTGGAISNF